MKNNNPLVSIITPSYNCEKYIIDTYKSVISQSYINWQWIIVDDCSTDSSLSILKNLEASDNRITVLSTDSNLGSAAARNLGIKVCVGKYITFLDSDDLLDSNYIESQILFIKENGPIITAGYRRLAKKSCTSFMPKKIINYRKLLYGCDTSCLTTMYDQEIIGKRFFDETLKKDEDYIYWLNILKDGYIVKTNRCVIATYRIRKESKNGNKFKLFKPIYNIYHNALGFNLIRTFWHIFWYFCYGVKKYWNVR